MPTGRTNWLTRHIFTVPILHREVTADLVGDFVWDHKLKVDAEWHYSPQGDLAHLWVTGSQASLKRIEDYVAGYQLGYDRGYGLGSKLGSDSPPLTKENNNG